MNVNLSITIDIDDATRARIAAYVGQKKVTREEIKEFLWNNGAGWEQALNELVPADDDEDLI